MAQQTSDSNSATLSTFNTSSPRLIAVCGGSLVLVWLLLGKVVLILIGVACGVGLHAWWEQFREPTKLDKERGRRELGVEVAHRLTDWPRPAASSDDESKTGAETLPADFSGFRLSTATALDTATEAIIEQYVEWWYKPILPSSTAFPLECRNTLIRFIRSASLHLARKRPAETFLHFLTNSSSIIIVFLSELASALGTEADNASCTTAESIPIFLQRYPESSLSNLLSTEKQQEKLQLVASDILQMFLDSQLYTCELSRSFLCEILSGSILESTIASCSKPEYINGWIVYLLEQGEPELINALDAGLEQARKSQTTTAPVHLGPGEAEARDAIRAANAHSQGPSRNKNGTDVGVNEETNRVKLVNDVMATGDVKRDNEKHSIQTWRVGDEGEAASSGASDGITTPTSSNSEKAGQTRCDPPPDYPAINTNGPVTGTSRERKPFSSAASTEGDVQNQSLESNRLSQPPSHTLRNAEVSLIDDFNSLGGESVFRSKPSKEYLLQIEPASSRHQGWMVARQYADFEALHEILRRISLISGASSFAGKYPSLPSWKGQSKDVLRRDLEQYLRVALRYNPLADSQGMSAFFDKARESGSSSTPRSKAPGFTFPNQAVFETMGKGMLGALANAPKGVTGGGKAVIDGVTGVFGTPKTGNRKSIEQSTAFQSQFSEESSSAQNPQLSKPQEPVYQTRKDSLDAEHESSRGLEAAETFSTETHVPIMHSGNELMSSSRASRKESVDSHCQGSYSEGHPPSNPAECNPDWKMSSQPLYGSPASTECVQAQGNVSEPSDNEVRVEDSAAVAREPDPDNEHVPLSEDETMMTVELLFAVLNEMYSLSSVWKIRKALLNAAKSFLLRPGNPNLEYIRGLIQKSISENTSDEVLAGYINRMVETCVVTPDGSQPEYRELSDSEKETLRVKARGLFIDRGLPPALASVMGTSATTEALGRMFDSIQIPTITRGLVFAVTLQALKIVIQ